MTLWYVSRATGLISLALLSLAMVLGALTSGRISTARLPRFAVSGLHRNVSLLSLAFLAVHIIAATVDSYVSLGWADSVIPFTSGYRPFWIGLGAVGLDLLLAVVVTSLMRTRIPLRAWRLVHWSSYACWPVAVAHSFGLLASDRNQVWIAAFDIGCVLAVVAAVGYRAVLQHPDTRMRGAR